MKEGYESIYNSKKDYSTPELIEHGNIKDITKGTGDGGSEDYGYGCASN